MSVYGDVQLSVQIGELFPIKTWSCLENVNVLNKVNVILKQCSNVTFLYTLRI